uniref:LrgB family protein n=1 Tax=Gemmiger formicilis TaxID=745368 RepID=UPI0040287DCA
MSRYFTKTLASLEPYTPGEQLKIADVVKLNANENPYPPAPGVAAALAGAVIILTGIVGSLLGETVCKICRITDPLAKGLALGTSAHAI